MGRALLLTGRPGVGKTTIIRTVVDRLGSRAGGFYTEEIRERGRRTGFRLVAVGTESPCTGTLASVNISSPYRVSRYGVNLQDLERVGVRAVQHAVEQPGIGVVVVDEIGKMELFSSAFREAIQTALDGPKPVLGTVMAGSQPWVDVIRARSDVTVVEVTTDNRSGMSAQILRWLEGDKD
jgi:nucleoside-triphosphatase